MRYCTAAIGLVVILTSSLAAARTAKPADSPNMLTHGMVQMTLRVGETTQAEVLDTFGGPNVTTIDGQGREVWVYDRHATVETASSNSFSIGMLVGAIGVGAGGGGGLGFGSSKAKNEQAQRSMTLVIKFGPDHKVVDFKSRSSSF